MLPAIFNGQSNKRDWFYWQSFKEYKETNIRYIISTWTTLSSFLPYNASKYTINGLDLKFYTLLKLNSLINCYKFTLYYHYYGSTLIDATIYPSFLFPAGKYLLEMGVYSNVTLFGKFRASFEIVEYVSEKQWLRG